MSKKNWGLWVPLLSTGAVWALVWAIAPARSIERGIQVGMLIALLQSMASTGALFWAWNKNFFYWVWGGGVLFRMLVFAATAFFVYRHSQLSLVATMTTMVSATTLFLVLESTVFFSKPT